MPRLQQLILPACAALMLLGPVGCESDSSDSRTSSRSSDRLNDERYDREVRVDRDLDRDLDARDYERISRDRDLDRDRYDDAALSGARLTGIPRDARRVDSAPGTRELFYDARRDATVYVYDADADKVVYTGKLRDGDRFVLDPNDNMALINGKKVFDQDLKSRHVFRLYVLDNRDR